ncbi:MAG: metallophosphoesterase, partial [Candidatus Stahlbacteria bacterium]|nr:metallophosphoesterase [Candidatus Stahlbacteria bacterium]
MKYYQQKIVCLCLVIINMIATTSIYGLENWNCDGNWKTIDGGIVCQKWRYKIDDNQNTVSWSFVAIADLHRANPRLKEVLHWVKNNKDTYNIKFVILLGDIGDKGHGGISHEWVQFYRDRGYEHPRVYDTYPFYEIANILNDSLQPTGIPWIPVRGNHDLDCELTPYDGEAILPIEYPNTGYDYFCEDSFYYYFKNYPQVNTMYRTQYNNRTYSFTNGYMQVADPHTHTWDAIWLDFCDRKSYFPLPSGLEMDLYDWTGTNGRQGTYRYMQNKLSNITSALDQVMMFSHHQINGTLTSHEYLALGDALGCYQNWVGVWFSGHKHGKFSNDIVDISWPKNKLICENYVIDNLAGKWDDPPYFSLVCFMWEGGYNPGPGGDPWFPRNQGPCPYVYVWDGVNFQKDNSVIPASQINWTRQDPYTLTIPLQPKDGHYVLRVKEDGGTITYLDAVRLIAVDHPENTVIGTATNGDIVHYANKISPISYLGASDSGQDILDLISNQDSLYLELNPNEWLNVSFGNVSDSGWAGFLTRTKETDYPFIPWDDWETHGPPLGGGESGQRETLGVVFPRGNPSISYVSLRGTKSDGSDLNIGLSPLALSDSGSAKIDMIAYYLPAPDTEKIVHSCDLVSAIRYDSATGNIRTVMDELSEIDIVRTGLAHGDYVELMFAPPDSPPGSSIPSGWKRDFIVVSTGKYTSVPSIDTVSPGMGVIWPNGGEWFQIGGSYPITVHGQDNVMVESVRVYLVRNSNSYYLGSMYPREPAGKWGSNFTIPQLTPSDSCRILAVAYDRAGNSGSDESDANFSILKGTDHKGNDWVISSNTTIYGVHWDIGNFTINSGVTASLLPYNGTDTTGSVIIDAQTMNILGTLKSDTAGYLASEGTGQGIDGTYDNGAGGGGYGGEGGQGESGYLGGSAHGDSVFGNAG